MNKNQTAPNVVLDFGLNQSLDALLAGQPMALMPAELAKKLLKNYADNLRSASAERIIGNHITTLREKASSDDLEGAINASISWVQERDLINNVTLGNWDVYEVKPEAEAVEVRA